MTEERGVSAYESVRSQTFELVDCKSFLLENYKDETLKDIDFENLAKVNKVRIPIPDADFRMILASVKRDVEFFQNNGLMDYSLLLGVEKVSDFNRNIDSFDDGHILTKKKTDNFFLDAKYFEEECDTESMGQQSDNILNN